MSSKQVSIPEQKSPVYAGTGKEENIYTNRFSETEDATRSQTWKILCPPFLQKYIHQYATVVDLGAGDGNFILNIIAHKRIAVDSSPHVQKLVQAGIEVFQASAQDLPRVLPCKADVIFMSNFLEHMPDKSVVLSVLDACRQSLNDGGKVLILQPNIRYVGPAYWDYIDHHIALTEHSLVEALEVSGFTVDEMIPRFLPYTAKSRLGKAVGGGDRSWLIRLYLHCPLLWRFLGKQTFVVAHC